jgi:uncharacterized membrane protein
MKQKIRSFYITPLALVVAVGITLLYIVTMPIVLVVNIMNEIRIVAGETYKYNIRRLNKD